MIYANTPDSSNLVFLLFFYDQNPSNYILSTNPGDGAGTILNTTAIPINTWHHFALVRNGNNFTIYVNGIGKVTASFSFTVSNSSLPLTIGKDNSNGYFFNGYIDEFLLNPGANYTNNFTPRNSQY